MTEESELPGGQGGNGEGSLKDASIEAGLLFFETERALMAGKRMQFPMARNNHADEDADADGKG